VIRYEGEQAVGYPWLRWKWFVLSGYLLAWVPWLMLLARRSHQAEILGWWSPRSFAILLAVTLGLALASYGVWRTCFRQSRSPDVLAATLRRIRNSPWLFWPALAAAPVAWLIPVLYLARLATPLSPTVLASLLAAAGMVLVWEAVLVLAERPEAEQRDWLKKWSLLAASLLVSLIGVEILGRTLGIHQFAWWDINPQRLNVRFHTQDFDVRVVTNRQGLREPDTVPLARGDERRVVVVGDSMTFGWGVSYEDTFTHQTEILLRGRSGLERVRVINMGRPGANPRDYLRYVRRYAVQFQPELIVVAFLVGNDCPIVPPARLRSEADFQRERDEHVAAAVTPVAERYLAKFFVAGSLYAGVYRRLAGSSGRMGDGLHGPLFGEPNPLDPQQVLHDIGQAPEPQRAEKIYACLQRDGWIELGLNWKVNPWLIHSAILHPDGPADALAVREPTRRAMEQEWQMCEAVLRECRAATAEANAELVILAIPPAQAVSVRSLRLLQQLGCEAHDEMLRTRTINDWLAGFAIRSGIACVDPIDSFREAAASGRQLYFATDDHLNARGHRMLAEALAAELASRGAASRLVRPSRDSYAPRSGAPAPDR